MAASTTMLSNATHPSSWCRQGVGIAQVQRAVTEALRGTDNKEGRKALAGLLTRFFLFEELPPDVMLQLAPLFQVGADAFVIASTDPMPQRWGNGMLRLAPR